MHTFVFSLKAQHHEDRRYCLYFVIYNSSGKFATKHKNILTYLFTFHKKAVDWAKIKPVYRTQRTPNGEPIFHLLAIQ
jgi:hypothetical protein